MLEKYVTGHKDSMFCYGGCTCLYNTDNITHYPNFLGYILWIEELHMLCILYYNIKNLDVSVCQLRSLKGAEII